MIKLKYSRKLWLALVRQCPEGFRVSYCKGTIVIEKLDSYFSPWYRLDEIVESCGY